MGLTVLITALVAGAGLFVLIAWRERPERDWQTVELRFASDLTTETAAALLSSVAGLPHRASVALDVISDTNGIRHLLHAAPSTLDTLRGQWRGVLPTLRMEEPAKPLPGGWVAGMRLGLSGRYSVLRTDAPVEATAALLGALQPLADGEAIMVRWLLSAGSRPQLPLPSSRRDQRRRPLLTRLAAGELALRPEHLRALRLKYEGPVLAGRGVVAVKAGHPKRAAHLASRIVSVARSRSGAYGRIAVRRIGAKRIFGALERRGVGRGDRYAPGELAALCALPIEGPRVAGLALGTAPLLMPSPQVPSTGRVFGVSTWPGLNKILAQPVIGGLSHALLAGPSGVGKSSLICSLAVQDLQAGRGFLMVDGKGDLAEDVLARIPEKRRRDVLVLDPGREGPVPGLRLFGRSDDVELTADLILAIFADLYRDSWGPLSARWLRAALVLLSHDPAAALADLPFVFSNAAFRRRLIAKLTDPLARQVWASFEAMGPAERAHQLAAPLNKVEELVGRRTVRAVLGQRNPKLDLHEVLATGKVVIVSLAPGRVGSVAARLIGALVVHQFFLAVQARTGMPPEHRRPFFLYVDEPKVLGDIPVPIDSLYELARGMGCGVLLSVQSVVQLPSDLRAAATTNASTLVAFRQNAGDAQLLSRELPGVDSDALQYLGQYETVMRLGLGPGKVTDPASARTLPPSPTTSDPEEIRHASGERYGTDPAEVDAALAERHGTDSQGDAPVGVIRRKP